MSGILSGLTRISVNQQVRGTQLSMSVLSTFVVWYSIFSPDFLCSHNECLVEYVNVCQSAQPSDSGLGYETASPTVTRIVHNSVEYGDVSTTEL